MKKALNLPNIIQAEKKESKSIEFTHELNESKGWDKSCLKSTADSIDRIVYLGSCDSEGDMFAVYHSGKYISIFKGHLNDGTY